MRVLVLFAHPVETSFGASLHATVVETLRARGHEVDDCDLNAEGFDPVMTRQDRIDYYDVPAIEAASVLMSTACSNPTRSSFPFRSGTWAFPRSSRASSTKCSCRASASI